MFCEDLKDTPIYLCICYERLNFCSKSVIINEKIKNKTKNMLNHKLQLTKEENTYVCIFFELDLKRHNS